MKQIILTGWLALLCAILMTACQPEEPDTVLFEPVLEQTTLALEEELSAALEKAIGQPLTGRTESDAMPFGTLDYSSIIKRISDEDQPKPNYTIRLIPPDSVSNTEEYYVIIGEEDGFYAYILQYEPDKCFEGIVEYDRSDFTGHVKVLDLQRNVMSVMRLEDGVDVTDQQAANGRNEEVFSGTNCNCKLVTEQQDVYHKSEDRMGYTHWTKTTINVTILACFCKEPSTLNTSDGGGTGPTIYKPGTLLDETEGSYEGGIYVSNGEDPDQFGTADPNCAYGTWYETGECLTIEKLENILEESLRTRFGSLYGDCLSAAKQKSKEAWDSQPLMFITAGVLEYMRCRNGDDKATTPEGKFLYGFLNSLIDEIDATAIFELREFADKLIETQVNCLSEKMMTGFAGAETEPGIFNEIMRCTFGLDITQEEVLAAYILAEEYAKEVYTDPYEQGRVSAMILSMFSPTKVLQTKKITRLLSLAKLRKVKELLVDIRGMSGKTVAELRELLKKHKLRDRIFDTQRDITEEYRHIIADESTARKGNFGEMATDVELTKHGYKSLHDRINDIDALTHQGIDGIFEKDGLYYIVESKYGTSTLSNTIDGRQMSDSWIRRNNRLNRAVGIELAEDILDSGYQRILAKTQADGSIKFQLINKNGDLISGRAGIFTP